MTIRERVYGKKRISWALRPKFRTDRRPAPITGKRRKEFDRPVYESSVPTPGRRLLPESECPWLAQRKAVVVSE